MIPVCFVDTNLLVYQRDSSDEFKQARATEWLVCLTQQRAGRLSTQVLNEFFVTVTQKLDPGMSREEAWADVTDLMTWRPHPIDAELLKQCHAIQERYQVSWWDSLIVAAASTLQCDFLLSEDLSDGQHLDGVTVVDPFRIPPGELFAGD